MTAQSHALGAINLSQGFPDEDPPSEILDLFDEASQTKGGHQYSDPRGTPILRRAIASKLQSFNGIDADPDRNIIVTCGATEALLITFRSLFEAGDELLTFSPVYENYFLQARSAGLKVTAVELSEPAFAVTGAQIEEACTDRTRAILICNPCNPTGKVFGGAELEVIAEIAERRNLIIISDETYERFIWQGKHVSIASLPNAHDRTVTIFSMGKTYSVTGWRVGCVVAPETCIAAIAAQHELTTVNAPHPCQLAIAKALQLPESFYSDTIVRYSERKVLLTSALFEVGVSPWNPAGSYFLWCDYSRVSAEADTEFTSRLLRTAGVAGVPGRIFYHKTTANARRIRLTFSKSLATISEAARRLKTFSHLLAA